jgi:uncharacterized protein YdiU (UPF0061 family)
MTKANRFGFAFDNSYARDLEGFYVAQDGAFAPAPQVVRLNEALARDLGLDPDALRSEAGAHVLAGSVLPEGASPLAMAYAGHQFGGFSPQLGDGRALLLGEVKNAQGHRRDIHLKGSGRTPFSRGGDGKAVLGPVLREYLMGEAMAALGIPTTRALAATTTGAQVLREAGPQPGAVLARIGASHLRVGTFQFFAARGEAARVSQLLDYCIARHDPELADAPDKALLFLRNVIARQALLVAAWMGVGFIHGVMNTDNMTISGETIDYGPCAFMDRYDPETVFSSIDQTGRYAYANQPGIARWNLARLAETLLPFLSDDEAEAIRLATVEIDGFIAVYEAAWTDVMRAKLGFRVPQAGDAALATAFLAAMQGQFGEGQGVDFTNAFRALSDVLRGDEGALAAQFTDRSVAQAWQAEWRARLDAEGGEDADRAAAMEAKNPTYIPRNHLVETALAAAGTGDLGPFDTLMEVLTAPFTRRTGLEAFSQPAPDSFAGYRTFCGT